MSNIALNDILEMRAVCTFSNQISINVWHFKVTAIDLSGGPISTGDLAQELAEGYNDFYANIITDAANFYGLGFHRVYPVVTLEEGWAGAAIAGRIGGGPLPAQVCGILGLLTGLGGRKNKGRKFMPFPAASSLGTDANPSTTYKGDVNLLGAYYLAGHDIAPGSGSTAHLTAVLKHHDNTTDPVTETVARGLWGQQRSRGGYGRPNVAPLWPS